MPEEFTILETYSDLSLDRPKLNDMRQWVRDKWVDAIIAYTLDRLSRDPVHLLLLQDEIENKGVELILVTETLDSTDLGKLISHIKGYAAKLEALKIRERCLRGLKERAKLGKLTGGRSVHLYGYYYDKNHGKRIINEQEAQIMRDMFKRLAEGGNVHSVPCSLMELGLLTPTGKSRWNTSTVHKILTNTAYIGRPKTYHGIEMVDSTPALITDDLFNYVQARLRDNKKNLAATVKRSFYFEGILIVVFAKRDTMVLGCIKVTVTITSLGG